jgi:diaminopimelate decarboxylase
MKTDVKIENLLIQEWNLETAPNGELVIGGCNAVELSKHYGTPLHVVNEESLKKTAESFLKTIQSIYPGKATVHFAFKCNPVPGIIKIIKNVGINAEIMSEYEHLLALKLGFNGDEIVVNGPYKTDRLIKSCLENNVRFINVDSIFELKRINEICNDLNLNATILLRINPDFTPTGMNKGSATASRIGSPFGLDMKGGELIQALELIKGMTSIKFKGYHIHIGSGIQNTDDFRKAILKLKDIVNLAERYGFNIEVLDVGGGLGVPHSREMSTLELLLYQAVDHLPTKKLYNRNLSFDNFADSVTTGVLELFRNKELPELIFEPGRCIVSPNQLLLLKIHQIKERPGIKKWLITDAAIGTLTMPTFYEHHAVILCNDINRKLAGRVTIAGPGCFAADIVYRNKSMPEIQPGEIIAIMDSGAYFTSWESNFGFPRPAIVLAANGEHKLLRTRETFDNMISRDIF